jgi:hypothetical protein
MNEIAKNVEEKEKDCPVCEMQEILVGVAVANVSCSTIKDEEKRGECMQWATGIDPTKMSAMQIMEEAYDRAGLNGLAVFPKMHNAMIRSVIIKKVGDKLRNNMPITKNEEEIYKKYTKEQEKEGI